jgi:hypothetical protein
MVRTDILDRGIPWVMLLLRERVLNNDLNLQTDNRVSVACTWLLWGALLTTALHLMAGVVALVLGVVLLSLNLPVYRFFHRERGFGFALMAIPWHWLYYTYNGLCVVLGVAAYLRSAVASTKQAHSVDFPGCCGPTAEAQSDPYRWQGESIESRHRGTREVPAGASIL